MLVSLSLGNLSNAERETVLNTLGIDPAIGLREFVFERLPPVDVTIANEPVNFQDPSIDRFLVVNNNGVVLPEIHNGNVTSLNQADLLNHGESYMSFTSYLYRILAPSTQAMQQAGSPLTITSTAWQTAPAADPAPF